MHVYRVNERLRSLLCVAIAGTEDTSTKAMLQQALDSGICGLEVVNKACYLTGESLLDVLDSLLVVHRDAANANLAPVSRALLEKQLEEEHQLIAKSEKPAMRDVRDMQRELSNFVYGVFAVFGTGVAVYLALRLFAKDLLRLEYQLIASLLAATIVTVCELVYFIRLAYSVQ